MAWREDRRPAGRGGQRQPRRRRPAQAISPARRQGRCSPMRVDRLAPARDRRDPGGDRRRPGGSSIARRSAAAPSPPRSPAARAAGSRCATASRRSPPRAAPTRVLIHDAARPFLPAAVIDRLLDGARREPRARCRSCRSSTRSPRRRRALGEPVPRDGLVRVQTPQAFRFDAILAAHRALARRRRRPTTPRSPAPPGFEVATVAGDPALEKLTYEADFARAEARLAGAHDQPHRPRLRRPRLRRRARSSGSAASASRTSAASRAIATPTSLLHALTDALLGAIGAGDIGDHFPPTRPAMARRRLLALRRACPRPGRARAAAGSTMSTSPSSARRRGSARIGTAMRAADRRLVAAAAGAG